MKTLAYATTPNVNFKQILEPSKDKYTHKQERMSAEIKAILDKQSANLNNGRTYVDKFEKELNSDILILPNDHRRKLDVYAQDRTTGAKDIIKIFSSAVKPKESDFLDYLDYTKEDIREKNVNFIAYLLCGILAITAFSISGNKKGLVKEIEPIKKEVKANLNNSAIADSLHLTSKHL